MPGASAFADWLGPRRPGFAQDFGALPFEGGAVDHFGAASLASAVAVAPTGRHGYTPKDHFNGGALSSYWYPDGSPVFTVSGVGQAVGEPSLSGSLLWSNFNFNLVGREAKWETATWPTTTNANTWVVMSFRLDGSNWLDWEIASETTLKAMWGSTGGGTNTVYTTTLDPVAHRWLRVRESGGTVYWDSSADGANWTNRASVASPFALDNVGLSFQVGMNTGTAVTNWEIESFGIDAYVGAAAAASTAAVTSAGTRGANGAALLALSSASAVAGFAEAFGAAQLALSSVLASAGQRDAFAAAQLALAEASATSGVVGKLGASSLPSAAAATATGKLGARTQAALALSAAAAAAGQREAFAAALLGSVYGHSASGVVGTLYYGAAQLGMTHAADAAGVRTAIAAASLALGQPISASGFDWIGGASSLALSAPVSATGRATLKGSAALASAVAASARGVREVTVPWHWIPAPGWLAGGAYVRRQGLAQPGQAPAQGDDPPFATEGWLRDGSS